LGFCDLVNAADGETPLKAYSYDGLGRRVAENDWSAVTDLYYSAAGQVLEERERHWTEDPDIAAVVARYVWSPVYVNALILRDRDTDGNGSLEERLWAVQDANWNVVALVDSSGDVVERYAYTPYGQAFIMNGAYVEMTGGGVDWRYLFQGGRLDPLTGATQFGARDYDPALGRWRTLDPIGFAGGDLNVYRALGNDPVNSVDPTGLYEYPWSKNASWSFKGSIFGDTLDATLEPVKAGGDLMRAATWGIDHELFGTHLIYAPGEVPDFRSAAARGTPMAGDLGEHYLRSVAESAGPIALGYAGKFVAPYVGALLAGGARVALRPIQPLAQRVFHVAKKQAGAALRAARMRSGGAVSAPKNGRGVWDLAPFKRGKAIEQQLGHNLPSNFPTIDKFTNGAATSIKSMDLAAKTYSDAAAITRVGEGYIDKVAAFQGRNWAGVNIKPGDITSRTLELAVPSGATQAQQQALQGLVKYGLQNGVTVTIKVIP
jgi:RHS repeat-associated protein